ncbi:M20/M25/M40 family metallo-hydrolase [Candidatus Thorarchaeota archaeon]|nr:MAG: M20/M25/M40 family metallo-hydrolase [Candidatus Thorarchaeota archaeon]
MEAQDEIIDLMQEMVRNKCVNPPGNEMKSIRTIERFLNGYGVKPEVFQSAPQRGNLYAEIRGGDGPSFMLGPAHVDVVPVEDEERWVVPPFSGEVHDGFIWGRGTFDMLFIVACQVVAFARLHNDEFEPNGTLKLLIVSDEETHGLKGARWMIRHHPDKVKTDYLVTELGGFPVAQDRYAIQYGEKGDCWLRITAHGREQHGSMPFGSDNAVTKLVRIIERLGKYRPEVCTDYVTLLVEKMPISGLTKWLLSKKKVMPYILNHLAESDPAQAKLLHAISRMTISPNVIHGGTKTNVVPGRAYVDVDIRTLPNQTTKAVMTDLKKHLGDLSEGADIELMPIPGYEPIRGNESSLESPLVSAIVSVLKKLLGEKAQLVPLFSPGQTDSRFFRKEFGTDAYGFSLFDDRMSGGDLIAMPHSDNERVSLGTLDLTYQAYREITELVLGKEHN